MQIDFSTLSSYLPETSPEPDMTLIAAMLTEDAVFLGGDSLVGADLTTYIQGWQKVHISDDARVAWGWSGEPPEPDLYSRQIGTLAKDADWNTLAMKMGEVLAVDNGRRVGRMRVAMQQTNAVPPLTNLILAGWFAGRGRLADLDGQGAIAIDGHGFIATGAGSGHAYLVREVLRKLGRPSDEGTFRDIMAVAVAMSKDCDFPIHIIRIAQDGAKLLDPITRDRWELFGKS